MTDEELIAEAIAAGKMRSFPLGMTSEWETMTFKERRSLCFSKAKARRKSSMFHFSSQNKRHAPE